MTTNSWKYSTTISRQLCGHSKRNLPITDRMFTECATEMTIKGLKQPFYSVYIYIYMQSIWAQKNKILLTPTSCQMLPDVACVITAGHETIQTQQSCDSSQSDCSVWFGRVSQNDSLVPSLSPPRARTKTGGEKGGESLEYFITWVT